MTWMSRFACGAALLALAGCGWGDDGPESPLDEEQAQERVDDHISQTAAVLPDSVELEAFGDPISAACENDKYITVSQDYWLEELPSEENDQYAETVHEYWTDNGYTVRSDHRPGDLFINARHDKDGFTISLQESKQGSLSLGASSPCLNPAGQDE